MSTSVISRLRDVRESYARRRTLWRELGSYASTEDLSDLEAALARFDESHGGERDPGAEDVRSFLAAQYALTARRN